MELLRRVLREPLVQFLLLGGLLFASYSLVADEDVRDADTRRIVVDRDALITFMQYRASAFEPEYFSAQFDALSEEQVAQLAAAYLREEAMEREARALGMDRGDYVIRRRLIQKIEYLVADADLEGTPPDEEELRAYFEANRDSFRQEAAVTFTHVFVDAEREHAGGDRAFAEQLLRQLNARDAQFNDAPAYGDRFAYERNYVGRSMSSVANQFGMDFANALAALQPGGDWQGPIASPFGYHLVLLSDREDTSDPEFADVRDLVLAGVMEQRRNNARETLLDELVDQYDVEYRGIPEPPDRDGEQR